MHSGYALTRVRTKNNLASRLFGLLAAVFCFSIVVLGWKAFSASGSMSEAAASELNHHLAGAMLLCIAATILASQFLDERWPGRLVWPTLFIALGIFLAAWSDAEIWPRGPLSWSWLIHHDAEARQHKMYALILISIGLIEFLRARGKLGPTVHRWALPVLALLGAGLLTMHAHSGTSGLPAGWNGSQGVVMAAESASAATQGHMHHHDSSEHGAAHGSSQATASGHEHVMSASMIKVQRQHLWMTLAGLVFALSKFLADSRTAISKYMHVVWPSAMAVIGVLLLAYRE